MFIYRLCHLPCMSDVIMSIGAVVFFIVFATLLFTFILFLLSFFSRDPRYPEYLPKISVVIPVYNEAKNVRSCLHALRSSTYPHGRVHVIVVDDGSTDTTCAIVKQFSNITLVHQNHKGKVHALNKGIARALGEIVVTIDGDTIVEPAFLEEIIKPFSDAKVGATSGAVMVMKETKGILGAFQHVEYLINNLNRRCFSRVFKTGILFFGSLAAYRRQALLEAGGFKPDTLAEDWDIVLEIKRQGYKIINITSAKGYTAVPGSLSVLLAQRVRWWIGGMQALKKNRALMKEKNFVIWYTFVTYGWWALYAIISLPLIIYQIAYWMPEGGIMTLFLYFFRWFTMFGPLYVMYKLPVWGLNMYSIFGVLSGVFTLLITFTALFYYRASFHIRNFIFSFLFIFLYFPYILLLNLFITYAIFRSLFLEQKFFVK